MPIETIQQARVIPLVQADDTASALNQATALLAGGLRVIEVVLRTPDALSCLETIVREIPDAIIGAGTVLSEAQAAEAVNRGADFIVSPGLDKNVVAFCQQEEIPVFPGVITPSEIIEARNMGLRIVKFFPAEVAGGPTMLRAFSAVFPDMRYIPTGGVSAKNLKDYLALPAVIACGGSWLTPKSAIDAEDYNAIKALADEALLIARS